jgi:hypothetical protein
VLFNANSAIFQLYHDENKLIFTFYSFAPETLEHLTGKLSSRLWKDRFLKHGDQEVF